MEEVAERKSIARHVMDVLIYLVIVVGIIFGLPRALVYFLETDTPMAAITSGSMWPALKEGDLVLIRGTARGEFREGDIVVFASRVNQALTIHRVVELREDEVVTKGDANFDPDAPVAYEDVVGKAVTWDGERPVRIPYLGSITVFGSRFIQP